LAIAMLNLFEDRQLLVKQRGDQGIGETSVENCSPWYMLHGFLIKNRSKQ